MILSQNRRNDLPLISKWQKGVGVQRLNLTSYILIDFIYLDSKIKNDEKAYHLFHQRKRGLSLFNVEIWTHMKWSGFKTDQMAYI